LTPAASASAAEVERRRLGLLLAAGAGCGLVVLAAVLGGEAAFRGDVKQALVRAFVAGCGAVCIGLRRRPVLRWVALAAGVGLLGLSA